MARIALVTDRERKSLTHDDRRLLLPMAEAGLEAIPCVWDDPSVPWERFDAIVTRSPWDYHHDKFPAFCDWLDAREADHSRVFNPVSLARWNTRKTYLAELTERGLPAIPSFRRTAGPDIDFSDLLARWGRIVVKPEVSAGGRDTFRVGADNVDEVTERLRGQPGVVYLGQPYIAAIESFGEASLVFIDGAYSHAVRKRAGPGGFLIHEEHGGTLQRYQPPAAMLAVADRVIGSIETPLFARVDLIDTGDAIWMVELELLEPELFFRFYEPSIAAFIAALKKRL